MAEKEPTFVTWEKEQEPWTSSPEQWGRIYAFIWRYKDIYLDRFENAPRQVLQEIAAYVGIDFKGNDIFHPVYAPPPDVTNEQLEKIVDTGEGAYLIVKLCC